MMRIPALSRLRCAASRAMAASMLLSAAVTATAQVSVGASIPETASLTISHDRVVFDLAAAVYPPAEFPAYYMPTDPEPGSEPMTFTVFTNLSRWAVVVDFTGLYNERENVALPSRQLEYSLDGVTWRPFSAGGVNVVVGQGPTTVHQTYELAVRLRIDGSEPPGTYVGSLTFTLTSD